MDPRTWGREKIIRFHTRDPVRLGGIPGPRLFIICYQDTIFLQFGSNKTKEDIPPVLNDPNVITSVLFWGLDSQHGIQGGNSSNTTDPDIGPDERRASGKIFRYLVKSFGFPFSNKILYYPGWFYFKACVLNLNIFFDGAFIWKSLDEIAVRTDLVMEPCCEW